MATDSTDPSTRAAGGLADLSDAELLAAHVDGDGTAFGELFRRHHDRLWAVALRTTCDPELAADGLQEAMIAAFRRAGSFRGDAQVTTWLHRVVVNACLDRLRAARVRRSDPLPEEPDDAERLLSADGGEAGGAGARPGDPVASVEAGERRTAVLTALGELSAEQRAAVVLVDMEGYPVAEVAVILGCAVGTVKSRCARGRARLAVLLSDLLPTEAVPSPGPEAASVPGNPPSGRDVGSGTRRGPPSAATATAD